MFSFTSLKYQKARHLIGQKSTNQFNQISLRCSVDGFAMNECSSFPSFPFLCVCCGFHFCSSSLSSSFSTPTLPPPSFVEKYAGPSVRFLSHQLFSAIESNDQLLSMPFAWLLFVSTYGQIVQFPIKFNQKSFAAFHLNQTNLVRLLFKSSERLGVQSHFDFMF